MGYLVIYKTVAISPASHKKAIFFWTVSNYLWIYVNNKVKERIGNGDVSPENLNCKEEIENLFLEIILIKTK